MHVDGQLGLDIVSEDYGFIGQVFEPHVKALLPEAQATATLWATATDLLEVCKEFKACVEASMDGEDFDWIERLYMIACAAIDKAEEE
jgi:hypothetical protein